MKYTEKSYQQRLDERNQRGIQWEHEESIKDARNGGICLIVLGLIVIALYYFTTT